MESKKEKAFSLFDQGYSAISPEVKALGLKNHTRGTYYWQWRQLGGAGNPTHSSGGESVGIIDETKQISKEVPVPKVEAKEEEVEANEEEVDEEEEFEDAKPQSPTENIGAVSEALSRKGKNGKTEGGEVKLATTISEDGIKCTVFLSLRTLAYYKIAATTQAQINGGEQLLLGDFIDTCVADYFSGRGQVLGLIRTGR